jgi:hypothetical protein
MSFSPKGRNAHGRTRRIGLPESVLFMRRANLQGRAAYVWSAWRNTDCQPNLADYLTDQWQLRATAGNCAADHGPAEAAPDLTNPPPAVF